MKKLNSVFLGLTMAFAFSIQSSPVVAGQGGIIPLSGEEMFRSIYFAQGRLVKDIPVLAHSKLKGFLDADLDINSRSALLADQTVEAITKAEPAFFAEFHDAIISGDYVTTRDAVKKGGDLFLSTVRRIALAQQSQGSDGIMPDGLALALPINVAVAVNVAGVINVAAAVAAYYYLAVYSQVAMWGPNTSNDSLPYDGLQGDMLTAQLVKKANERI